MYVDMASVKSNVKEQITTAGADIRQHKNDHSALNPQTRLLDLRRTVVVSGLFTMWMFCSGFARF